MYIYMFLAFKDPNGPQVTTRNTGIINRKRMWTQKPHRVLKFQQTSVSVTYIYAFFLVQHALPIITIMASWQLVHLGTLIYGYMLLAFRNLKIVQSTNTTTSIIDKKGECGLTTLKF